MSRSTPRSLSRQLYGPRLDFGGAVHLRLCPGDAATLRGISALTGWDYTLDEAEKAGKRIQTLRQAFNIREGANPGEWKLPERLTVAMDAGPIKGQKRTLPPLRQKATGPSAGTRRPVSHSPQP